MSCYNSPVKSKLSASNPYLRNPAKRARAVLKSVASSSAIEGIHAPFKKMMRGNGNPTSVARPKARVKT